MSDIMSGNYKKFVYVPPTEPSELMDCTSFVLDFNERKFVHTGLDSTDNYQEKVDIITSSRFVRITPNFLKHMLSIMGSILSAILDTPVRTKPPVFIEEESIRLTKMVYRGANVLVIESKSQVGCRVLLNKEDIFILQNLENSIFHSLYRKTVFTRPLLLKQTQLIQAFLKKNSATLPMPFEELQTYIMRIDQSLFGVPKEEPNFISDILIMNKKQLAVGFAVKEEMISEDQNLSPPRIKHEIMISAPLRKRSNKPMEHVYPSSSYTHSYPKHARNDHTSTSTLPSSDVQPLTYQDLVMDTCFSPISPPHPPSPIGDENDGPTYFNRHSPPPSPPAYLEDVPFETSRWNAKRNLFS